jgi:hypothetical protein
MLLDRGMAKEALAAYEAVLKEEHNRLATYVGATKSAKASAEIEADWPLVAANSQDRHASFMRYSAPQQRAASQTQAQESKLRDMDTKMQLGIPPTQQNTYGR